MTEPGLLINIMMLTLPIILCLASPFGGGLTTSVIPIPEVNFFTKNRKNGVIPKPPLPLDAHFYSGVYDCMKK